MWPEIKCGWKCAGLVVIAPIFVIAIAASLSLLAMTVAWQSMTPDFMDCRASLAVTISGFKAVCRFLAGTGGSQ